MTGRPLLSYRFILMNQICEKSTIFQWKIHERGTFCQKWYICVRDWNQAPNCTTSINEQCDGNVPSDGVVVCNCAG